MGRGGDIMGVTAGLAGGAVPMLRQHGPRGPGGRVSPLTHAGSAQAALGQEGTPRSDWGGCLPLPGAGTFGAVPAAAALLSPEPGQGRVSRPVAMSVGITSGLVFTGRPCLDVTSAVPSRPVSLM